MIGFKLNKMLEFETSESLLSLVVFIAINLMAGIFRVLQSKPNISWYKTLKQPPLQPPSWLFGPVWIVLFIMIGVSGWRVYLKDELHGIAAAAYATQYVLNLMWTVIFFGGRHLFLAMINLCFWVISIVWTIAVFKLIDETAAYLLVPYLCWTCFAAFLGASVWWLNRDGAHQKAN